MKTKSTIPTEEEYLKYYTKKPMIEKKETEW